ncbi:MAG: YbbR-like domain-containing protein [Dehalococcoidia bacterium]
MKVNFPKDFIANFFSLARIVFTRSYIELKKSPSLLLFSLIMSVSLWVFVTDNENPMITETFPVSINVQPVNIGPELAVANRIDKVQLRVSTTQEKLESLQSKNFNAFVDLNGLGAREQDVSVRVDVQNIRGVKVIEILPPKVTVNLENLLEKQVNVEYRAIGSPPLGYKLGEINPQNNIANIAGPASLIDLVQSVAADINITGLTVSLEQSFNVTPRGTGGSEIQGISVNPESIFFDIEIIKTDYVKTVPLEINLVGEPSYGYKISGIEISPSAVKITGSINDLQNINSVVLESLEIKNRSASLSKAILIPKNDKFNVLEDQVIKATVTIVPIYGSSRTIIIPKIVDKLNRSIVFEDKFKNIDITVRGPLEVIGQISTTEIKVEIDCSELEEGQHTVTPTITLPPKVSLVSAVPNEIKIEISE